MKTILLILVLIVSVLAGNTNEDKDADFARPTQGHYSRPPPGHYAISTPGHYLTRAQFNNPYYTDIKPGVKKQMNALNLQNYHRSEAFYNQNRGMTTSVQGTTVPLVGNMFQMPVVKGTENILPLVSRQILRGSAPVNKIDDLKEKTRRRTKALTKSALLMKQTYTPPNLISLPLVSTFKNKFYTIPKLREAAPNVPSTIPQPALPPKQNMVSKPFSFSAPLEMTHPESLPIKIPQDTANANLPFGIPSDSYRNVKSQQMNGYFVKEATVSTPRPPSATAMDRYTDRAPVQNHPTTHNAIHMPTYAGSSTSNNYPRNIHGATGLTAIQNHNLDSPAYHVPVTSNTQPATDQVTTQNWNNQLYSGTSNSYPTNTLAATEPGPVQNLNNNIYSDAMISNSYPKNTQTATTNLVPTPNPNTQLHSRSLSSNSYPMGTQQAAASAQSPNTQTYPGSVPDTQAPTGSVTNNPTPLNALDTPAYPEPFTSTSYSLNTQGVTDPALIQNQNNELHTGSLTPSSYPMNTATTQAQKTQAYPANLISNSYPADTQAPTSLVAPYALDTAAYPGTLTSNNYPTNTQVATSLAQNVETYPANLVSNSYPVGTQAPTSLMANTIAPNALDTANYPGTLTSNNYPTNTQVATSSAQNVETYPALVSNSYLVDTQEATGSVPSTHMTLNSLDMAAYPGTLTSNNYPTQVATSQVLNTQTYPGSLDTASYPGTFTSNNYPVDTQAATAQLANTQTYPGSLTSNNYPTNHQATVEAQHQSSVYDPRIIQTATSSPLNTEVGAVTHQRMSSSPQGTGAEYMNNLQNTRGPAFTSTQQPSHTANAGSPADTNVVSSQTPDFITSFFNQLKNHFQQKDPSHVPSYTQKYY